VPLLHPQGGQNQGQLLWAGEPRLLAHPALENDHLVVQKQNPVVAVVSQDPANQNIARGEQDEEQMPEHASRMPWQPEEVNPRPERPKDKGIPHRLTAQIYFGTLGVLSFNYAQDGAD
jgi:hypothetical protein